MAHSTLFAGAWTQAGFEDIPRFIDLASGSAEKAGVLTHRLLAFARRQSLDIRPNDINRLVANLEDLLHRTLGEQIELKCCLPADTWSAFTDANQLESALLNLAINARGLRKGHTLARRLRPPGQVLLRPRRKRALPREAARRAGQAFSRLVEPRLGDRGKKAEIDVHRLERARASVDRLEMTAGDVIEERADRSRRRRGLKLRSESLGGGEAAGDEADRGAFDVALAAGDLAGEAQA